MKKRYLGNIRRQFKRFLIVLQILCLITLTLSYTMIVGNAAAIYTGVNLGYANYDYTPSVMAYDGPIKMWWCGTPGTGDIIRYSYIGANGWVAPVTVLQKSSGGWDSMHTCDPSVIKGSFSYNGTNYNYAMYYTGSYDATGYDNHIGVAFSNDGVSWVKYSANPIINPTGSALPSTHQYGAGMPSAYISNGIVTVVYYDSTGSGHKMYMTTSADGKNFTNKTPLPNPFPNEHIGDIAYSPADSVWYIVTKNANDEEMYLYETANSSLLSTWIYKDCISSKTTGNVRNHNPGWLRLPNGDLYIEPGSGYKFVYFGTGTTAPGSWDIGKSVYTKSWEFNANGDRQGWAAQNVSMDSGPNNGNWVVRTNLNDPQWVSPALEFPASAYTNIELSVANRNTTTTGQIFFKTSVENYYDPSKSVNFTCISGGAYHTIAVNMTGNPKWTGIITGIRIDPVETGTNNDLGINYIRLARYVSGWDFNMPGNRLDWTAYNVSTDSGPGAGGQWIVTAGQNDPQFVSPALELPAELYTRLHVDIANQNATEAGQIFFKTDSENYYDASKCVNFTCTNGGGWYAHNINMAGNAKWTGKITGIRIDPIASGSGKPLGIDNISLANS